LRNASLAAGGLGLAAGGGRSLSAFASGSARYSSPEDLFKISLAEWSVNGEIEGCKGVGTIPHLEFPRIARRHGLDAVEHVNQCFFDKGSDRSYLADLKRVCDGEGVRSLLIMVDNEGDLGERSEGKRSRAVEAHHKWVEAAQFLGCHSVRVNARSNDELSFDEQQKLAADGLRRLCEFADPYGIDVIVENHGGLSSNARWLTGVMELVDHPRVGTLPDFGNFVIKPGEEYDRYLGVKQLMPYARAVSAKAIDFDDRGDCIETDYHRMMRIVLDAGYRGYVGIEYEGPFIPSEEGIQLTKVLLERVREELAPDYM
jgi:sugar phosphate isomerase/epimerase